MLSFEGTDVIPAISFLEKYYGADVEKELVGASVPATEHSVMCMGEKESEVETFKRLLELFPKGILSVVSDTWDLWKVCTEYLPELKKEILARDGKLVIRPDSGDPVKIITGYMMNELIIEDNRVYLQDYNGYRFVKGKEISLAESKGVIQLLWDGFGGITNDLGFKVLDTHIGAIYGDSINLQRAAAICEALKQKGFASQCVFGVGSFTYQYNTRDTFGMAMKATYVEVDGEGREIFKNPITDDGTKKSATGLLQVKKGNGKYILYDKVSWEEEADSELVTVYKNGKIIKEYSLEEIRMRLADHSTT
ncbi:MAG: nicotinate phosphoribosyltransferase, partial [Pedobacter sp.]